MWQLGMQVWDWVGVWVFTNVSKECSALIFTVKRSRTACLLKMKALWSFSMSGTSNPWHSIIFQKMWIPIATRVCTESEKWHRYYYCMITGGHAIGQAHQNLLTTEVSVQTQGSPCGFMLDKFILGQVFLWDPLGFISPILHAFSSSEAGATGHRTKELKSHCYIQTKLCRNSIYSAESGDTLPDKKSPPVLGLIQSLSTKHISLWHSYSLIFQIASLTAAFRKWICLYEWLFMLQVFLCLYLLDGRIDGFRALSVWMWWQRKIQVKIKTF